MATISKYETSSGKTLFEVRYRTPDHRSTRKRGFETLRDAKAFAATTETAKLKGEFVSVALGKTTVGTLGPAWLERQSGHLKPSTVYAYERTWRVLVEPRWGHARIGAIRPSDVQGWVSELSAPLEEAAPAEKGRGRPRSSRGHGASGVRQAHNLLALILDDAVKDGMLATNPARGVKLPEKAPRRNVYLTRPQLRMLADECVSSGNDPGLAGSNTTSTTATQSDQSTSTTDDSQSVDQTWSSSGPSSVQTGQS